MVELYANDFMTTLTAPVLIGDDHIHVITAAPAALQGGQFRILVAWVDSITGVVSNKELMLVTAGAATTTWTVTRGVEGTTPAAHAGGAPVAHVLTAESLLAVVGDRALYVDVRDFGVRGTGNDETTEMQTAFTQTPAGATLFLPHPQVLISATLHAASNIRLLGQGTQVMASEIKQTTPNTTAISFDAALWDSSVEHLIVNSDVDQSASGCGIYAASDIHLNDVFVRRFYDLVKLDTASYFSSATRCRFVGFAGTRRALSLANVNNFTADHCQFWECEYGVHATAVQGLRIRDCVTEENTVAGIYVDGGFGGVIISGCYFEEVSTATAANIVIGATTTVSGVLIEGNWFDSSGSATYHLELDYADRVTLIGNGYRSGGPGLGVVRGTANTTNVAIINQEALPASGLPYSSMALQPLGANPWHLYWWAAWKTSGSIHYWRLGEASGSTAVDKMGTTDLTYYNAPTLGAPGPLADDAATAVTFASASSHLVEGPDTGMPSGASARTLMFWVNPVASPGLNNWMMRYGTMAGAHAIMLFVQGDNHTLYLYDGVADYDIGPVGLVTAGVWHHIAFVYTGSDVVAYTDGVGRSRTIALDTTLNGTIDLGHNGITGFNGSLAEFQVLNRALSADEIQRLYHFGHGS